MHYHITLYPRNCEENVSECFENIEEILKNSESFTSDYHNRNRQDSTIRSVVIVFKHQWLESDTDL